MTKQMELTTGEKLSSIFGKLKLAVKNLKSLISLIGTTDISTIGDGTITGGLSDVNGKLSLIETINITTNQIGFYCYKNGKTVTLIINNAQRTWEKGYVAAGFPRPVNNMVFDTYSGVTFTMNTDGKLYSDSITDKWVSVAFTYLTND